MEGGRRERERGWKEGGSVREREGEIEGGSEREKEREKGERVRERGGWKEGVS